MDPDISAIVNLAGPLSVPAAVEAPYAYLHQLPGNNRNMRYQFLVAFNKLYFAIGDADALAEIGSVIATFHDASLLIDDIEDSSTVRRGSPCAHLQYGVPLTINAGNLMYFVALRRAVTSLPGLWQRRHPDSSTLKMQNDAYTILVDEMLNLHVGQGLDIYWRDNLSAVCKLGLPTVAEYLAMVMNKTGGLFRLSVRLLALFLTSDVELHKLIPLANLLGIIYQIRDDYLNLVDERYSQMKGTAGEDLVEGKLSLPILHCMLNNSDSTPVHEVLLGMKTSDDRREHPKKIAAAIDFMKTLGSLEYAYNLLQEYANKALEMLSESDGDTAELEKIVLHLGSVARA